MAKEGSRQERDGPLALSDASSDTVSVTLSDVSIYTPSSADEGTVAADQESEPLLSEERPPQYEDITTLVHENSSLKKSPIDDDGDGDSQGNDIPLDYPTSSRRRCCRRKRSTRARRALIFLKIAVLLGVLSYFLVTLCLRFKATQRFPQHEWDECPPEYLDSSQREIVVDKGSQAIWGRWPLYDLLSLSTTSGSIAVAIEPQPADPEHPDKPAKVVLQTTSGAIAVSFSAPRAASLPAEEMKMDLAATLKETENGQTHNRQCKKKHTLPCQRTKKAVSSSAHNSTPLPARPYELEIRSETGSISGRFIFSTSASIISQSGSIQALFIPVIYSDLGSNASLVTQTVSGSQHLEMSEPVVISSSATLLSNYNYATSSHSSDSGTLNIQYPGSWAGTVEATGAGPICLEGEGLQVTKDGQGHATGVRHPREDDEKKAWWGSSGNMMVELKGQGINFFVRPGRGE